MKAKVILFGYKDKEIANFLNKFYTDETICLNCSSWQKEFANPVEITDFIAAFADNSSNFDMTMWISLDEDAYIKISSKNSNSIIKYLFERYPY